MAYTALHQSPTHSSMGILDGLRARWSRYQKFRQVRDELGSCSDRELSDLGISRFDIHGIAREAATS